MKRKDEKLSILDDLIERAEREQYGVKGEMHTVVQEADMFIRNCAGRAISVRWASQTLLQLYVIRAAQKSKRRVSTYAQYERHCVEQLAESTEASMVTC
jgi:hypothetical protein